MLSTEEEEAQEEDVWVARMSVVVVKMYVGCSVAPGMQKRVERPGIVLSALEEGAWREVVLVVRMSAVRKVDAVLGSVGSLT